jgi:hypothetical protein
MGGRLVRDFENFNFLHLEIPRTREKHCPVQSGVVRVTVSKSVSVTARVCVTLIDRDDRPWSFAPFDGPSAIGLHCVRKIRMLSGCEEVDLYR